MRIFIAIVLVSASCGEEPPCCPLPSSWAFCESNGGELESRDGVGGSFSLCVFPDGSECSAEAFERGECSPGDCDDYVACFIGAPCSSQNECPGVCIDDDVEDATPGVCSVVCELNADCESGIIGQDSWTCDSLEDPAALVATFDRLADCPGAVSEQPYGCRVFGGSWACMPDSWQR